jgi:hypothetical protein
VARKDSVVEAARDVETGETPHTTLEALIPGLYRGLLERELIAVPGRREDAVKGLARAWSVEAARPGARPDSRATLVSGLTLYAHTDMDPYDGAELESAAAALLWPARTGGPLPALPYAAA